MARLFDEAPPAELIEKDASDLATQLAREQRGGTEQTKTQLRRFYQEFVGLRARIMDEATYKQNEAKVKMMLSKAAYARRGGGKDAKIPEEFYEWFTKNVRRIDSWEDVHRFGEYFEALVGYFYNAVASQSR